MDIWDTNETVVIWGTGNIGKKTYYKYRSKYKIAYFIDSFCNIKNLYGVEVRKPWESQNVGYKIIIAISGWEEVAKELIAGQYKFYFDFLPYFLLDYSEIPLLDILKWSERKYQNYVIDAFVSDKLPVFIYGNCQTGILRQYLLQCRDFRDKYIVVNIPLIYEFTKDNLEQIINHEYIFAKCSICITQIISKGNKYDVRLSTDEIISKFSLKTRIIKIPNLYFDVYFPAGGGIKCNVLVNEIGFPDIGIFQHGDLILDELAEKQYTVEDIFQIISLQNLYNEKFLNDLLQYRLQELQLRETACDIKMVDYIEQNFRKQYLFYTRNHPSNIVIRELCIRILKLIDCKEEFENETIISELNVWHEFIHPSVKKGLKLEFDKKYYADGESNTKCLYTYEQIIRKYLSYCHEVF